MNPQAIDRLFNFQNAFDHPVTVIVTAIIFASISLSPALIFVLATIRRTSAEPRRELWLRYRSWLVLIVLMISPILLGAMWTILGVTVLSLVCYAEYARATGLFRHKAVSMVVVLGVMATMLTALDNWPDLFIALIVLAVVLIQAIGVLGDEPKGYIQRTALGVVAFLLFGACFGHLAFVANDVNYRPMLLTLFLCVEMNDVFAFVCGKMIGGPKLAPNTSPNKTIAGGLGAMVLTTLLVFLIGHFGLQNTTTPLREPLHLILLGVIISVSGQFGDLMMSAIKRDIGLKDIGRRIPGHGGVLDRFDSLLLVCPAVFHYVNYFHEFSIGHGQPQRILSNWLGG